MTKAKKDVANTATTHDAPADKTTTPTDTTAEVKPQQRRKRPNMHQYKITVERDMADTLAAISKASGISIRDMCRTALAHLIKIYAPHYGVTVIGESQGEPPLMRQQAAPVQQPYQAAPPHQAYSAPRSTVVGLPGGQSQGLHPATPQPAHAQQQHVPRTYDEWLAQQTRNAPVPLADAGFDNRRTHPAASDAEFNLQDKQHWE